MEREEVKEVMGWVKEDRIGARIWAFAAMLLNNFPLNVHPHPFNPLSNSLL